MPIKKYEIIFTMRKYNQYFLNKEDLNYIMEEYDTIIIGGGCAGYPAAIYSARFNLKTLVITKLRGGLITTTHLVENYPGFISLTGQELADNLQKHVEANNVPISDDEVSSIEKEGDFFIIKTSFAQKTYKSKTVILATGTEHRHLGIESEKQFQGKGVSYCATCDSGFFKDKIVGIVGGGDAAAKEAMVLAQNSSKVYIFVRNKFKAEPINIQRLEANPKIEIIKGVNVKEIQGEIKVTNVILDKEINGSDKIDLDGLFIAIGQLPQNELAKQLEVELNQRGEIIIDKFSTTSVKGVFAAGDVTNMTWKQGIVGAAEGSIAGYSAFEYIDKNFK